MTINIERLDEALKDISEIADGWTTLKPSYSRNVTGGLEKTLDESSGK